MSSIIIDKLKQIDKAGRDDKQNYSVTGSSSAESTCSDKKKKTALESSDQQSSGRTSSVLRTDESEYYEAYHIAKVWAGKLRKLARCQKLFAEKAIYDILFEAQLGNLHKSSVKINGKSSFTKRSPSETSHSRSSYTSKSTKSTPRDSSLIKVDSGNVEETSSEVLISESFPNENGLVSLESQPDNKAALKQNLSKVNPPLENTRNQTFIVATTQNTVQRPTSDTELALEFENENAIEDNVIANAATNTPDCILKQLSRYIRDCYDNCKNYLPPTQQ